MQANDTMLVTCDLASPRSARKASGDCSESAMRVRLVSVRDIAPERVEDPSSVRAGVPET